MGDLVQFLPRVRRTSRPSERLIKSAQGEIDRLRMTDPDCSPTEDTAPCELNPDNLA